MPHSQSEEQTVEVSQPDVRAAFPLCWRTEAESLTLDLGPGTSVFIEGASYSKSTSDFVAVLLTYLQPRRGEGKLSDYQEY